MFSFFLCSCIFFKCRQNAPFSVPVFKIFSVHSSKSFQIPSECTLYRPCFFFSAVQTRFKYRQNTPFTVLISNFQEAILVLMFSPPPPPSFGTNMYSFSYCSFKYCVKYCQKASFSRPCSQTRAVPNRSK